MKQYHQEPHRKAVLRFWRTVCHPTELQQNCEVKKATDKSTNQHISKTIQKKFKKFQNFSKKLEKNQKNQHFSKTIKKNSNKFKTFQKNSKKYKKIKKDHKNSKKFKKVKKN